MDGLCLGASDSQGDVDRLCPLYLTPSSASVAYLLPAHRRPLVSINSLLETRPAGQPASQPASQPTGRAVCGGLLSALVGAACSSNELLLGRAGL